MKVVLAMALFAIASVANAITLTWVSHNQTSGSGTISSLITDGTAFFSSQTATTAIWNWDGTTLTSTGIYNAVGTIGSSPYGASILEDSIVDLSISSATSTATGISYACLEGTFLSSVGTSGCGGYQFGSKAMDESTTTWGPGLAFDRTIGGNDILTGPQRSISAYDFTDFSVANAPLHPGDEVIIGNGVPLGTNDPVLGGGEKLTFSMGLEAVNDASVTGTNLPVDIAVLANDVLDDAIANLQVATGVQGPQKGTAVVIGTVPGPRAGLSVRYTPDPSFVTGADTFDYTVTDQSNTPLTATVTVTISNNIIANDDGKSNAPFASMLVGETVSLDVLANDTGLGNAPLTVMTVNPVATLGIPTVTGSPGDTTIRILYSAGPDSGPDSFGYQLSDSTGDMDTATVFVEVLPLNIPIANDDAGTIAAGEQGFVEVLVNDEGLGDTPLTVSIFRNAANGFVGPIQRCDQQVSCRVWYTPNDGFFGTDSFQYTVTDDTDETSNIANVVITVSAPQDKPVAVDDTPFLPENSTVMLDVLGNDSGLSDTPLSVTTTTPTNGTATVTGSPGDKDSIRVKYTPNKGGATADGFSYTVTDVNDNSSTARVEITIILDQDAVPGKTSAVGPVGLGLLMLLLPGLRRRRD